MYSTREAAELVGISFRSLTRWIAERKIKAPALQTLGTVKARVWAEKDIKTLKKAVSRVRYKSKNGRRKKSKKVRRA